MYSVFVFSWSVRNTSNALTVFTDEERSYVSVGNWIQRFKSCQFYRRKRISVFVIDESMVQTSCKHVWILIAIETCLQIYLVSIFLKKKICL